MTEASVAVVGCGHWGKNLVRNVHSLNALRTVVESRAESHAKIRELAPGARVVSTLAEALDDDMVRGVMIATPAETHFELARQALQSGRDVFVEKPMTLKIDDSRELVQLAEQKGRILMVGHLLEYHPALRKIHGLINEGVLGESFLHPV